MDMPRGAARQPDDRDRPTVPRAGSRSRLSQRATTPLAPERPGQPPSLFHIVRVAPPPAVVAPSPAPSDAVAPAASAPLSRWRRVVLLIALVALCGALVALVMLGFASGR